MKYGLLLLTKDERYNEVEKQIRITSQHTSVPYTAFSKNSLGNLFIICYTDERQLARYLDNLQCDQFSAIKGVKSFEGARKHVEEILSVVKEEVAKKEKEMLEERLFPKQP